MNQHQNLRFELKSLGAREFDGYGSVFGNRDLGGQVVLPGAFARSLAAHKADASMPSMFWMHQADQVPGVWLDMAEDDRGLYVKGEIVDTALGRDVRTLLQKQAVRGLSIGFYPVETDWRSDGARLLKQVDLFEVSIVSMAMNPMARVQAVKARLSADGEYVPTEREVEQHFRALGCSKVVSRTIIARLFDGAGFAGGMLSGTRWDAGSADEDEEERKALEALAGLIDRIGAQALRRD